MVNFREQKFWERKDYSGGVNLDVSPDLLKSNELSAVSNVDPGRLFGSLKNREGFTPVNKYNGAIKKIGGYYLNGIHHLLVDDGTGIYDGANKIINLSGDTGFDYALYRDRILVTKKELRPKSYRGNNIRDAGLDPPGENDKITVEQGTSYNETIEDGTEAGEYTKRSQTDITTKWQSLLSYEPKIQLTNAGTSAQPLFNVWNGISPDFLYAQIFYFSAGAAQGWLMYKTFSSIDISGNDILSLWYNLKIEKLSYANVIQYYNFYLVLNSSIITSDDINDYDIVIKLEITTPEENWLDFERDFTEGTWLQVKEDISNYTDIVMAGIFLDTTASSTTLEGFSFSLGLDNIETYNDANYYLDGTYTYKTTFYHGYAESSPGPSSIAKYINGKATLSDIPTSSQNGILGRKIYRASTNNPIYKLAYIIEDNTTTTLKNDDANNEDYLSDSQLGEDLIEDRAIPPNCEHVELHYSNFIFSNTDNIYNRVYWSRTGELEAIEINNYQDIGEADVEILGMKRYGNIIYFLTNKGIYSLVGTSPIDYNFRPVLSSVPVVSRNSVIDLGNTIGYISYDGFYLFSGNSSKNILEKNKYIFDYIISLNNIFKVACAFWHKKIYLSYASEDQNNKTLVMDTAKQYHTIYDKGFEALYAAQDGILYGGDSDGIIWKLEDNDYLDRESKITCSFTTNLENFNENEPKILKAIEFDYKTYGNNLIVSVLNEDGIIWTSSLNSLNRTRTKIFLPENRGMFYQLTVSSVGRFEWYGERVKYIPYMGW